MKRMSKSKIKCFFTASIILFPIFNSAHIGDMNFGFGDAFLLLTYTLVFLLDRRGFKLGISKESFTFWLYIFYLGFISVMNCFTISSFEVSSMLMPLIRYIFYGSIIFFNKKYVDYEYGINFYINVCLIETIYGLIQFMLTVIAGITLPYVLPFTTMEYGMYGADYNAQLLRTLQYVDGIRLVGFFPEASHFAQYTILSIIFLLYKKNRKRRDLVKLCLISISILLTKSSVGIIALLFVIVFYMVTEQHLSVRKFIRRIGMILVGVVVALIINDQLDVAAFIQERISRVSERTYAVSGNLRLIRGYMVFSEAPWNIKIFGIGCGNYAAFINQFRISTFFDHVMDNTNEYMNAFSLLLIRSGIIGAVIFSSFSIKLFKGLNKVQKIIFVVWLELLFTENIFFSPLFVLFLWFMVAKFDVNSLFDISDHHDLQKRLLL